MSFSIHNKSSWKNFLLLHLYFFFFLSVFNLLQLDFHHEHFSLLFQVTNSPHISKCKGQNYPNLANSFQEFLTPPLYFSSWNLTLSNMPYVLHISYFSCFLSASLLQNIISIIAEMFAHCSITSLLFLCCLKNP